MIDICYDALRFILTAMADFIMMEPIKYLFGLVLAAYVCAILKDMLSTKIHY